MSPVAVMLQHKQMFYFVKKYFFFIVKLAFDCIKDSWGFFTQKMGKLLKADAVITPAEEKPNVKQAKIL